MDPYAEIFKAYTAELAAAHADALTWWERLVSNETTMHGSREAGERAVRMRWPLGPTSYPRVIAVFRKYFLAVDELNSTLVEQWENVPQGDPLEDSFWGTDDDVGNPIQLPRTVLYERLDAVDKTLGRFMDSMVFVPVGADRNGKVT